ncbi:MAG: leucine-rich repeat protein [Clostridia bacterium]|nr:leucine-rich repeat protein [Clostridia bacterium]
MRRWIAICAAVFVLLACMFAVSAEEDAAWTLGADGTLTVSCEGVCNGVSLSEEQWKQVKTIVFTEGVTEIGDYAFDHVTDHAQRVSLVLPEGLTKIGREAFLGNGELRSIRFPSTLREIGYGAFAYAGVTEIVLPSGVTVLSGAAFYDCVELTSVTLSDTLVEIGDYAFHHTAIESIELPSSLDAIGHGAFAYCYKLRSLTVPEGVLSIGGKVFWGCGALEELYLPASLTSIGESAFRDTNRAMRVYLDADNAHYCVADDVLFTKDRKILVRYPAYKTDTAYTVPDGVETIFGEAFCGAENLTLLTLPEGLKTIGGKAFAGCTNLKRIVIPESVTALEEVSVGVGFPDFTAAGNHGVGPFGDSCFAEIVVLSRTVDVTASYWGNLYIPDGVTICCYHYSATDKGARKVKTYGFESEFTVAYLDEDHEHSYTEAIATAPSCTAEGEKTFTCSICGWTETEGIAKLDHTFGEAQITPATCLCEGEKRFTCTGCAYSYTELLPKTEHVYDAWDLSEISCVASDVSRKCRYCGREQTETLRGNLHTYGEWTETVAPTMQAAGKEQRVCTACGDAQVREVAKLTFSAFAEPYLPYLYALDAVLVLALVVAVALKKKKK